MVTRLRERWVIRKRAQSVIRAANAVAIKASESGQFCSVEDAVPVISVISGLKISVVLRDMDSGLFGFTAVEEGEATIFLSSQCTTMQHTLAHELGHVLLGHCHGAALNLPATPAGCEELLSGTVAALENEALANEHDAELFAERLLSLLPEEGEDADVVVWRVALQ